MQKKLISLFTITTLMVTLLSGCGKTTNSDAITKTGVYFDTVISITLYGTETQTYFDECFSLADKYENYFSNTIENSDISKINNSIGSPVSVHKETIDLIKKGITYGNQSSGSFDITIGALSDLWSFDTNEGNIPMADDISAAISSIDYHNISIDEDNKTVTLLKEGAKLDLGGIAKGYIADEMKSYLNSQGITSGLINLGGNVLALGAKGNGEKYTIGIQKPFSDDGSAIASIKITDESVVTSGTYQRYFEKDNIIYHHILDVKTGYPYENDLSSVTIINHSSVDGDGLSTTVFTMGLEEGLKYVESLDDTEAIFISNKDKIYYTSGIGTKIPFTEL